MGPATSFACPPLTLRTSSSVSTTYAVVAASSEFSSPEESGRVLWVWEDDNSLKANEKQKLKRSKLVVRNILSSLVNKKSDFGIISFHSNKSPTPFSHLLNFLVVL